jgi:hypothetical protein
MNSIRRECGCSWPQLTAFENADGPLRLELQLVDLLGHVAARGGRVRYRTAEVRIARPVRLLVALRRRRAVLFRSVITRSSTKPNNRRGGPARFLYLVLSEQRSRFRKSPRSVRSRRPDQTRERRMRAATAAREGGDQALDCSAAVSIDAPEINGTPDNRSRARGSRP